MKWRYLFLLMAILISGCSKHSFTNINSSENYEISNEMINAAEKVCEKNGGLKSFEVKKDKTSSYFFCTKQGFLEVTNYGKVQTVRSKVQEVKKLSKEDVSFCREKCPFLKSISIVDDSVVCICLDDKKIIKE